MFNDIVQLKQLHLKNFRCFSDKLITFESPLVLIEGLNGVGKTSLLEALHYLCYLRSFRTYSPRDLLQAGHTNFFIKAIFEQGIEQQELQVGFSGTKRLVKMNQKVICSFKELLDYYRIVTLTEDDLACIKEGPDVRRSFIDQVIILYDAEFTQQLRAVRTIADNRNRLLQNFRHQDKELYTVLTQQLWTASTQVQYRRTCAIEKLSSVVQNLLRDHFDKSLSISLTYKPKMIQPDQTWESFVENHPSLYQDEVRFGRSLFGAHLDDMSIHFEHRHSRSFASRGQQKLIILLLKIAQIQELLIQKGSAIFLLDDFMTDFDEQRAEIIVSILASLKTQLIFTAPSRSGSLEDVLKRRGVQKILLTH